MMVLALLFMIIIGKRILFQNPLDVNRLIFHLVIITLTLLSLFLHKTKDVATRLVPHLICLLSFFGHTRYLAFVGENTSLNTINRDFSMTRQGQAFNVTFLYNILDTHGGGAEFVD